MEETQIQIQKNNLLIKEENNDTGEDFIIFELGEKKFALLARKVLEILKIMEFDYPSELPTYLLGLIQYDEVPLGVIDLREVFKTDRIVYNLNSKIIVIALKSSDSKMALICDKVIDIKKLPKKNIHKLPYQGNEPVYSGVFNNGSENIYILNCENILKYIEKNQEKYIQHGNCEKFYVYDSESAEILKSRKNFAKQIKRDVQVPKPLYDMGVSFIINDIKYYINMASVKEFYKVNNSKFIRLPSAPEYIFGLINIKGEYITVLDIRRLFGYSDTIIKEKTTIIIINSSDFKLGILSDEICESMNINYEEIIQNRLQKQDENFKAEFVKDGEIYQILDIEQLLKDERLTICC